MRDSAATDSLAPGEFATARPPGIGGCQTLEDTMGEHAGFHEPIEQVVAGGHGAPPGDRVLAWRNSRPSTGTTSVSTPPSDESLRVILAHNRDEEKEHAAMTLEWLRRHDPVWDDVLRTYLFTEADIIEVEQQAEGEAI